MSEDKLSFSEALSGLIEKHFGGTKKEVQMEPEVQVTKALDEEERMALFVVLEPEAEDAHGDIYSEKEVEKACVQYNLHCRKANLYHRVDTEAFSIVQSFITPVNFETDAGTEIKKGTWLAWCKFEDDSLWEEVKKGNFNGLSVGCRCVAEDVE